MFDVVVIRSSDGRIVRLGQRCCRHQVLVHGRATRSGRLRISASQLADCSDWKRNVGGNPGCRGRDGTRPVLGQWKKLSVKRSRAVTRTPKRRTGSYWNREFVTWCDPCKQLTRDTRDRWLMMGYCKLFVTLTTKIPFSPRNVVKRGIRLRESLSVRLSVTLVQGIRFVERHV